MNSMSKSLENKIKKLNKLILQSSALEAEIEEQLEKEGFPYGNVTGNAFLNENEPVTEGLSFITHGECKTEEYLDEALNLIKEVFNHFSNLKLNKEDE